MDRYTSIFSFHTTLLDIEKAKNKKLNDKVIELNQKIKILDEIIKKQEKLILDLMKYKLLYLNND